MATHSWVLPWFALAACVVACLSSIARIAAQRLRGESVESNPVPSLASWALFVGTAAVLSLALLKIGALSTIDFVPARGLLLGSLCAAAAVLIGSRSSPGLVHAAELSVAVLGVTIARLWLTHGEVSGFAAFAVGFAAGVVCLEPACSLASRVPVIVGATAVALTAAVGFTRASTTAESYWADIPLLVASVAAMLWAIGPTAARKPLWTSGAAVIAAAACFLLFRLFPDTLAPAFALAIGAVVVLLAAAPSAAGDLRTGPRMQEYVAGALAIAGATASFLLAAGYGVGLMAIGGLMAFVVLDQSSRRESHRDAPLACLSFATVFLAYRLALLGTGQSVRSKGPGDVWDLIAIGLGIVGPAIVAALLPRLDALGAAIWNRCEYLFAAVVPVAAFAYIWQPRAFAGLFVGVALSPLLFSVRRDDDDAGSAGASAHALTAVLIGAVLLELMPALGGIAVPTRSIRIGLAVVILLLAMLRATIPLGRVAPRSPGAEGEVA